MDTPDIEKFLNTIETKEINEIVGSVLSNSEFDVRQEINDRLSYTKRVSVNDIVPEEYQQKLMDIDYTMSQCYWMIGDIANDLINSVNLQMAKDLGKVISRQDIFEAVGFFCHRTGRSVRYYYESAWYFPLEVRKKYDVPFNIYAVARWVKDWELLLKLAEANPIWSAERVRAEYYKTVGEDAPVRPREDKENGAEVRQEDDLPLPNGEVWEGAQTRFKAVLLSKLERTTDDLRGVLDRIPLPTEIRRRIGDVLLEIQDIQLEIRREV